MFFSKTWVYVFKTVAANRMRVLKIYPMSCLTNQHKKARRVCLKNNSSKMYACFLNTHALPKEKAERLFSFSFLLFLNLFLEECDLIALGEVFEHSSVSHNLHDGLGDLCSLAQVFYRSKRRLLSGFDNAACSICAKPCYGV